MGHGSSVWPWDRDTPQMVFHYVGTKSAFLFFSLLLVFLAAWVVTFQVVLRKTEVRALVRELVGVTRSRVSRVIKEVHRKTFHFYGLLIPVVFFFASKSHLVEPDAANGYKAVALLTHWQATMLLASFTALAFTVETARMVSPAANNLFLRTLGSMIVMREEEKSGYTGTCWYLLGCTLSVALFSPRVAVACMLYLVLGDGAAALVGVSFGRTKLPRMFGGKSLEGSVAMLLVCFSVGTVLFYDMDGAFEVLALVGALVATLVELYPVLNDNVSIPLLAGLAIHTISNRMNLAIPAF